MISIAKITEVYKMVDMSQVDTSLFRSEYEVMMYDDLMRYPSKCKTEIGSIGLYDTVLLTHHLLDQRSMLFMDQKVKDNFLLMYKRLYEILDDLADWDQITLNTESVRLIKTLINRLRGLINE